MKRNLGWCMIFAIFFLPIGCSKTTPPQDPAAKSGSANSANVGENPGADSTMIREAPAVALAEFLEAVRTGNGKQASAMLTQVARQKAAALNLNITPPPSDTAKFNIGRVKYVGPDGAQVTMTWTDLDEEGQSQTDKAVWVLRKETEGWRVAGVAAEYFPNEPPVFLNFEDPEELKLKREQVLQEMQRRSDEVNFQAQESEHREEKLRR